VPISISIAIRASHRRLDSELAIYSAGIVEIDVMQRVPQGLAARFVFR
jgi:hypothetical protein